MGLLEESIGQALVLRGARWLKMAETLETKRVGGARTMSAPKKRQKKRARNFTRPETASVLNDSDQNSEG